MTFLRTCNSTFALISVALLAACSGGTATTPPGGSSSSQTHLWQVQAGASSQQEAYQGLSYYPNGITIDAGDTITWTFPAGEPHTVTLLGPRSSPPPPSDPTAPQPAGGNTYDGSTYTSSGFLLAGKTYSLTFTKAGTYMVYCLLHPGMAQKITVQPAGSAYPQTQSDVNAEASSGEQNDLQIAANALPQFPYVAGGPHIAAGMSYGLASAVPPPNSTVMRFLDGTTLSATSTTITAGTTVTWTNLSANSPHTVTFPVAGQPLPQMNPFSPASGPSTYDGTQLVNSGVMMPGQSFSLTFTVPGTYTYDCLFHDDTENMIGTIVVQ